MTTPTNTEQLARFAAEQAQRVIKKIPLLGPVSWLMMNNPSTRHAFFADATARAPSTAAAAQPQQPQAPQTPPLASEPDSDYSRRVVAYIFGTIPITRAELCG